MLSFQTRQEPLVYGQSALVAAPNGDIDDRTVRQFEQQLQDYFNVGYRFVILNCAGIRSINSTGLEVLLKMIETFQEAGGIFLLMQVQVLPQISKFFDMLGFSPIFTSFTNKQEAVSYLITQIKAAFEASGEAGEKAASIPPTLSMPKPGAAGDGKNINTPPHPTAPAVSLQNPSTPPAAMAPVVPPQPVSSPMVSAPIPASSQGQPHMAPVASSFDRAAAFKKEPKIEKRTIGGLTLDVTVTYYRRMYPAGVYPCTVAMQSANKGSHANVHVTPHFPGCLVVPPHRTVHLQDKTDAVFWITPLARQAVEGWIELGKGEEASSHFPLPCKIVRQTLAKWLALLAVVVAGLLRWPGLVWPEFMIELREHVAAFAPAELLWLYVGGIFLLLAAIVCIFKLPGKINVVRQVVLQKT